MDSSNLSQFDLLNGIFRVYKNIKLEKTFFFCLDLLISFDGQILLCVHNEMDKKKQEFKIKILTHLMDLLLNSCSVKEI